MDMSLDNFGIQKWNVIIFILVVVVIYFMRPGTGHKSIQNNTVATVKLTQREEKILDNFNDGLFYFEGSYDKTINDIVFWVEVYSKGELISTKELAHFYPDSNRKKKTIFEYIIVGDKANEGIGFPEKFKSSLYSENKEIVTKMEVDVEIPRNLKDDSKIVSKSIYRTDEAKMDDDEIQLGCIEYTEGDGTVKIFQGQQEANETALLSYIIKGRFNKN